MSFSISDLHVTLDMLLSRTPTALTVVDDEGSFVFVNAAATELLARPAEQWMGKPYVDLFEPLDRPKVVTGVREVLRLYVPERSGELDVLVNMFDLVDGYRMLVLADVTESMQAHRNAVAQSQVAASLTYGGDLRTTLDAIAASVCSATGCLGCSVTLFENEPLRLETAGYHNLPPSHNEFFVEASRLGLPLVAIEVYRTGDLRVRNNARDVIAAMATQMGSPYVEYLDEVKWTAIVSLPLRYHDTTTGTLNCFYDGVVNPSEAELRFLQSIADQASVAVENARLFAQAEGKAILEERQRLARELHDSVSQALYGIGLGARTALERLEPGATAREPVEYVLSLAQSSLAEMRALIFELRPEALENEGLVVTLQQHLGALSAHHGLSISSDLGSEPPLDARGREALYRVAREALTNSVKHATARHVAVTLRAADGSATLIVQDDGSGFDPTQRFPGHLGLTSMRERMQRVGGSLELDSGPGRGTRLCAVVPLSTGKTSTAARS